MKYTFANFKKSIRMANDEDAIFECCRRNDVEGLTQFIRSDINVKDMDGSAPLHYTAWYNYIECLNLLLEAGADPNIKDMVGSTPLHYAAFCNSKECLKLLLEAGAEINPKNNDGYTPLHYTAWYNYIECLQLLLEAGADPNAKNNNGHTPLDCIKDEKFKKEMEAYIQELSTLDIKEPSY